MNPIPRTFSQSNVKLFYSHEIETVYNQYINGTKLYADSKKVYYYNIPCSFDIETTSFYENSTRMEKRAIMYAWALGLNGAVIIGRTWQEFIDVYTALVKLCRTHDNKRLRIYVHNMAFDFQFFRKWLSWKRVFSVSDRKVVDVETIDGIEFRCSYLLSGYSLAKLGTDLQKYKVKKAVGDLDYQLLRHSKTPLTYTEIKYLAKDVLVVMAYIQEQIEIEGNITKIPLTKTGYVRRYCKNMCFYGEDKETKKKTYYSYRNLMKSLTLEADEYTQLKHVFAGGLTHCNALINGKTLENIGSFDLTSSYPTVMISEKFPMSKGEKYIVTSTKDFDISINKYNCIFDVEFTELEPIFHNEHILSYSKCWGAIHEVVDNGRVVSADRICTSCTEVDFKNLMKFYQWKSCKVGNMIRYMRGYLPTNFVKAILTMYKDKTELKGVEGAETEYLLKKGMLNAAYGMTVTDIVRDDIIYSPEDEWNIEHANTQEKINKYNKNKGRFLFYPWGIYVTSYARRNLISAIYNFDDDYCYSDTDSVKGLNYKNHLPFINQYNDWITNRLLQALRYHQIPESMISPKTIEGKIAPMGVWDFEGEYKLFKTLGAKRYMTLDNRNQFSITVAGLNKNTAIPYLLNQCDVKFHMSGKGKFVIDDLSNIRKVFDIFDEDLFIPSAYTGKNTHTYIDDEHNGVITDYKGTSATYYEKSGVHLSEAEYSLSLSRQYIEYLKGLRDFTR